jgi:hypothetical protein
MSTSVSVFRSSISNHGRSAQFGDLDVPLLGDHRPGPRDRRQNRRDSRLPTAGRRPLRLATPALGEFDDVAVRMTRPNRAFPRLIMGRFKELNPSRFQLFVSRLSVVSST